MTYDIYEIEHFNAHPRNRIATCTGSLSATKRVATRSQAFQGTYLLITCDGTRVACRHPRTSSQPGWHNYDED
jgi:hypothetical protein